MKIKNINIFNINLAEIFFYFAILTISFDIFLVFKIGFTFRISQIFLSISFCFIIYYCLINFRIERPIGIVSLLIWSWFLFAFIPNTNYTLRSVGYIFWLTFNILTVIACVQLFNTIEKINRLLKCYIFSFFITALFGLIQFTLPLLNIGAPFVQQWWIPNILPRINGFSYEPSYFATYMIIGYFLSGYFIKENFLIVKAQNLKFIFLIILLSILLSSSRLGLLMIFSWFIQYPFLFFYRLMKWRFNKRYFQYFLLFLFVIAILVIIINFLSFNKILFIFSGLGIFGTASHSITLRTKDLYDTIQIFLQSPIFGYSLGGVSSAIGELRGVSVESIEAAKSNEGLSVLAETLAASGIIGFIPFLIYIFKLIMKPIYLVKFINNLDLKKVLIAMIVSLVFELIILQFNQNILRPYLWLHIAILSAVYNVNYKMIKRDIKIEDNN